MPIDTNCPITLNVIEDGLTLEINDPLVDLTLDVNSAIIPSVSLTHAAIPFLIDGGGAEIVFGDKGEIQIPFPCQIVAATMFSPDIGSVQVDIKKCSFNNYPSFTSICGSTKPTITSAYSVQDTSLTGWTTTINDGDILRYSIVSVSNVFRLTISLKVTKL
jgi:hypothetical protein